MILPDVRIISMNKERFQKSVLEIKTYLPNATVKRWPAVRGSDLFEESGNLRANYKQILSSKYPQVHLEKNNLLSPQAIETLRSNDKSNVLDFENAAAVGCALSHISCWQYMVQNNIEAVIICEDDIDICVPDFAERLRAFLQDYSFDDFDILNFNAVPFTVPWQRQSTREEPETTQIARLTGLAFRAQGYLLTLRGAKKLIQRAFPLVSVVDGYISQLSLLDSQFLYLKTIEPWLYHPLLDTGSQIGYSYWKFIKESVLFVPKEIILLLALLSVILVIIVVVLVCKLLQQLVFKQENLRKNLGDSLKFFDAKE